MSLPAKACLLQWCVWPSVDWFHSPRQQQRVMAEPNPLSLRSIHVASTIGKSSNAVSPSQPIAICMGMCPWGHESYRSYSVALLRRASALSDSFHRLRLSTLEFSVSTQTLRALILATCITPARKNAIEKAKRPPGNRAASSLGRIVPTEAKPSELSGEILSLAKSGVKAKTRCL
jgi:hypothetical protein